MFKCPNDCVGKLPAALEGYTIRKFMRRICPYRCSNQASGLEGSCWREEKRSSLWHYILGC